MTRWAVSISRRSTNWTMINTNCHRNSMFSIIAIFRQDLSIDASFNEWHTIESHWISQIVWVDCDGVVLLSNRMREESECVSVETRLLSVELSALQSFFWQYFETTEQFRFPSLNQANRHIREAAFCGLGKNSKRPVCPPLVLTLVEESLLFCSICVLLSIHLYFSLA